MGFVRTSKSGPVGTVVTINGTGFSTTASQNTVKFNGVTATVSSATNSQIQVTVLSLVRIPSTFEFNNIGT